MYALFCIWLPGVVLVVGGEEEGSETAVEVQQAAKVDPAAVGGREHEGVLAAENEVYICMRIMTATVVLYVLTTSIDGYHANYSHLVSPI